MRAMAIRSGSPLFPSRRWFLLSSLAALAGCAVRKLKTGNGRKVLIVGAGAAGLGAARALHDAGYDVVVVEGRDRIGGRVWTDNSFGHPLDLGASWIHESLGNPIRKLTREYDIETAATDYLNVYIARDGQLSLGGEGLYTAFARWNDWLNEAVIYARRQDQDVSIAAALAQARTQFNFNSLQREFMITRKVAFESELGEDLIKVSATPDPHEGSFLGNDRLFPDGYIQVLQGLAKDIDVRLGQTVTAIRQSDAGVEVETEQETHAAEYVIVTLPLGVLKKDLVSFEPELPEAKRQAIDALGMGTLNKVAVKFPKVFWPEGHDFLARLYTAQDDREISLFLDWSHYTGEPTIIAFTGGSLARSLEDASDEENGERVRELLGKLVGEKAPEPTHVKATRWTADPFSFGSYSNRPVGVTGVEYDTLAEPFDRVLFAGEATNRKYPATVHGAYLSGLREAERVGELVG